MHANTPQTTSMHLHFQFIHLVRLHKTGKLWTHWPHTSMHTHTHICCYTCEDPCFESSLSKNNFTLKIYKSPQRYKCEKTYIYTHTHKHRHTYTHTRHLTLFKLIWPWRPWTTITQPQRCYLKSIKCSLLAPNQLLIYGPREKKNTPWGFEQTSSECRPLEGLIYYP